MEKNVSIIWWTARTGVNKSYEKGCKDRSDTENTRDESFL
jgi:hypothetical protein